MSLEFRDDEVRLIDSCGAEEALELADWFSKVELPKANLAACTHLHAALLQTLLAYKPAIAAGPDDPFLARWVFPMLTAAHVV
jgi:hypothetical protein